MSLATIEATPLQIDQEAELARTALGITALVGETMSERCGDAAVDLEVENMAVSNTASVTLLTVGAEPETSHSAFFRAKDVDAPTMYGVSSEHRQSNPYYVRLSRLEQDADGTLHRITAARSADERDLTTIRDEVVDSSASLDMFLEAPATARSLAQPQPDWELLGNSFGHHALGVREETVAPVIAKLLQITGAGLAGYDSELGPTGALIQVDFGSSGRLYTAPGNTQKISFELSNLETQRMATFRFLVKSTFFQGLCFVEECSLYTDDRSDPNRPQVTEEKLQQRGNDMWRVRRTRTVPEDFREVTAEKVGGDAITDMARSVIPFVLGEQA